MLDNLYNTDILSLAATLKNERLDQPDGTARKVSKLCGSWLEIDVKVDDDRVTDLALRLQACALGQASAAILQKQLRGATLEDIQIATNAFYNMLKSGGEPPSGRFAELSLLAGVKDYPARHNSTLLAFDAALEAMTQALATSGAVP